MRDAGQFRLQPGTGAPEEIRLRVTSATVQEAPLHAAHEFGHYLDYAFMGGGFGSFASESFSAPSSVAFREAVERSPTYRRLAGLRSGGRLGSYEYSPRFVRYLMEGRELFARAYAQFVAERSGQEALVQGLRPARQSEDDLRHWKDDEFRPIAEALEAMLRENQMIE